MIYHPLSQHIRSTEYPLAAGATLSADGQALVVSNANGVFGVAPSAGVAGEVFLGFVCAQTSAAPFLEQTAIKVDQVVSSAGGVAVATFTPVAGTLSVLNPSTGAAITGWTLGAAGSVSGLADSTAFTFVYTYALTVPQAVALMGNQVPSGYAGSLLGSTGCSQRGKIYTNQIDTSVDWTTVGQPVLAANGQLTSHAVNANGVYIPAQVIAYPTSDYPYLGLEFSAI